MKITLYKSSTGWCATFSGVTGMPEGVTIPLPFGSKASAEIVRADFGKRFPGVAIAGASVLDEIEAALSVEL